MAGDLRTLHFTLMFCSNARDPRTDYSFRHVVSLTENITVFRVSHTYQYYLSTPDPRLSEPIE